MVSFGKVLVTALGIAYPTVSPGDVQQVTWSDIPSPSSQDWYGLFAARASDSDYIGAPKMTGTAAQNGSGALTIPLGTPPGNYEIRLFGNKTTVRLATSQAFNVLASQGARPGAVHIVGCHGAGFNPGGMIDYQMENPQATAGDVIVMVVRGTTTPSYVSAGANAAFASGALTIPAANLIANNQYYELHLQDASGNVLAISETFVLGIRPAAAVLRRTWDIIRNSNNSRQDVYFETTRPNGSDQVLLRLVNDGWNTPLPTQYTSGMQSGWAYFIVTPAATPGLYEACFVDGGIGQISGTSAPFTVTA